MRNFRCHVCLICVVTFGTCKELKDHYLEHIEGLIGDCEDCSGGDHTDEIVVWEVPEAQIKKEQESLVLDAGKGRGRPKPASKKRPQQKRVEPRHEVVLVKDAEEIDWEMNKEPSVENIKEENEVRTLGIIAKKQFERPKPASKKRPQSGEITPDDDNAVAAENLPTVLDFEDSDSQEDGFEKDTGPNPLELKIPNGIEVTMAESRPVEILEPPEDTKATAHGRNAIQKAKYDWNYKCSGCDFRHHYRHMVSRHVNKEHRGIKYRSCPECDYEAMHGGHLQEHIKNAHEKVKDIRCEVCPFATGRVGSLTKHINRMHMRNRERS